MTKKLTRAEKDQIIYNEGHGILHPEYYCYTTKSGSIQIRKRKQALTVPISENKEQAPAGGSNEMRQQPTAPEPTQPTPTKKEEDYDSVSNKQLLEKMLEILEKNNNTNNNQNLNDPEREKEKEENKQFIENIRTQEERHETEQPKEEPKHERPEQREPRERALRTKPQPRGRRFIEPIKRIQEEQEQTTQPIKKVRGRIL